jgi:hypothetical protein
VLAHSWGSKADPSKVGLSSRTQSWARIKHEVALGEAASPTGSQQQGKLANGAHSQSLSPSPPILHCSHHLFPDCPPRERAPAFSCLLNPPGIKHPVSPTSSGQRILRDCANVESCARRLRDVDNRVFAPHAAVHPARFNKQPADLMNPSCPSIYLPTMLCISAFRNATKSSNPPCISRITATAQAEVQGQMCWPISPPTLVKRPRLSAVDPPLWDDACSKT